MPNTKPALGAWLRKLRTTAGLTQAEVGAALGGIEARSIRRWENSGDVPGGLVLLRLLDAYGIEVPTAPDSSPRAVNVELLELRQEIQHLRQDLRLGRENGSVLEILEPLLKLVAEQGVPGPVLQNLIRPVAERVRETADLLLEQADQLEARLSDEASG